MTDLLSWLGFREGQTLNQRDRMFRAAAALMWTVTWLLWLPIIAAGLVGIVLTTWAVMDR